MARKLDDKISAVLKSHGFGPDACWDCHGVWVIYHRVLEEIGAKAGIRFDPPMIVEAHGGDKIAALCATGHLGDKSEWSIGEAAPGNNKNAYPWAMAEKRAKDRVILKLIGLHGLAYSEDEADDFKPQDQEPPKANGNDQPKNHGEACGPLKMTDLKEKMRAFLADLAKWSDPPSFEGFLDDNAELLKQCKRDLPGWWNTKDGSDVLGASDRIEAKRKELERKAA